MKLLSVILSLTFIFFASEVFSRDRVPTDNVNINTGWKYLDCGRGYKTVWVIGRDNKNIPVEEKPTYKDLIDALKSTPSGNGCAAMSHQQYLVEALKLFSAELDNTGPVRQQAEWGMQEAFACLAEARLVLGNDLLINALRARFKKKDEQISQIEMLGNSVAEFKRGLDEELGYLLNYSGVLRESGTVNPTFPFLVENTEGPVTNNEFMQYTELLNRYGMAAVSEAKYFFYKDNVKDIDNPPYGNFPGVEDLDFNGDGLENDAGRKEAAKSAKVAASNLYLQGTVLAALQEPNVFQNNNGYQLKRQLNEADRLYIDIQSGFNPLKLAGDFVPYQQVENFLNLARTRVTDANISEEAARDAVRTYEVDQTTMAAELRGQATQFIDQIEELTGLSTYGYTFTDSADRERYKNDVHDIALNGNKGQIGIQYHSILSAAKQAQITQLQLDQIPVKIQNEEQRNSAVTELELSTGQKVSAMQMALTMANSRSISISWPPGMSVNPDAPRAAALAGNINMTQSIQRARMDDIASALAVKNLLLEGAVLDVSLEHAQSELAREWAIVDTLWSRLDRLMANYAVAQGDFAEAYYNNPAYRLEASRSELAAEDDFETAIEFSYFAAKALEYMWSEKFNNPVLRLDGGMPEPLAVSFDPFMRAESVFSAQFASRLNPSLDNYLDALQAWDVKMRQLRSPGKQTATARFSLRDDIFGLGQYSPEVAEAKFRALVSKGRYLGENTENPNLQMEFTINIADETLFPAHPNIKIETISANMVSTASRSIRGDSNMNPPLIDMVMLDRAHVRTFFAEYPKRDDMLSYQLQGGRSIDKSPFIATVEATVDGYASPQATPNAQLSNHSPAVSTWVLRIKNNRYNNRKLKLEYLSDIELEVQYSFGKPRDIQFYN